MSSHQSTNHQLRPQAPAPPSCQSHYHSKSQYAHSVCYMSSKHHAPSTNQRSSDITSIINKPITAQRILKQTPLTITQRHRTCQVAIIGRSSRPPRPWRSNRIRHGHKHSPGNNSSSPRVNSTSKQIAPAIALQQKTRWPRAFRLQLERSATPPPGQANKIESSPSLARETRGLMRPQRRRLLARHLERRPHPAQIILSGSLG